MTKHFSFSTDLIFLSFFSVFFFCLIFFYFTRCFEKNLPAVSSEKKSHPGAQMQFFFFDQITLSTLTVFEIFLFNGRSVQAPTQRGTGSEIVN